TDELESLAEKLKQAEVKKVCLHLLHASRNPVHEVKAAEFLREKNFEVFVPEKTDNADEVSRWNKNALNAIIGNLFLDLKKNIEAALQDVIPSENIYYLTAQGEFTQDLSQSVSCLAAGTTAMAMNLREKSDVLYLGLENFVLISGQCWNIHWQSSWGSLENKQISFRELAIQPTQEISLNAFQHFDFGKDSEGWEPGPMFLGRGHKGMLLDLWAEDARLSQVDGFGDRQSPVGVQRFKNSLRALAKVSHSQEKEPANIISELQHLAQHKVALEALLFRQHEKILVTGPLANLFEPSFKKDAGKISIKVDDFAMSRSLALLGQSLLKG
ncbi:MAG TPA: hypothetical protein VN132_06640, partial [Bdellovibrio sp.]|nr:hypothetical protein [Bdellovibrio sp.]